MLRPTEPGNGRGQTEVFAFPSGRRRPVGLKRDVRGEREDKMLGILSM
jgi:hypothetical protein